MRNMPSLMRLMSVYCCVYFMCIWLLPLSRPVHHCMSGRILCQCSIRKVLAVYYSVWFLHIDKAVLVVPGWVLVSSKSHLSARLSTRVFWWFFIHVVHTLQFALLQMQELNCMPWMHSSVQTVIFCLLVSTYLSVSVFCSIKWVRWIFMRILRISLSVMHRHPQ